MRYVHHACRACAWVAAAAHGHGASAWTMDDGRKGRMPSARHDVQLTSVPCIVLQTCGQAAMKCEPTG
eukprot:352938-Chlamydomonas_euryale.AAC.6